MAREWKVRLDDATRTRWDAAAAREGENLAEFVKGAVEGRIEGRLRPQEPPLPVRVVLPGKPFRGPDPKVKGKPKS